MKNYFLIIFILFSGLAKSQSNLGCYYDSLMTQIICGNMTIQGDPDNICDDGVHLWVQFTPGSSFSTSLLQEAFGSTDSFKVVQEPFHYETQSAPVSANILIDDIWGQIVQLPFKFCFFENKYTSLVIGANGQISFDLSLAGQFNGYSTIGWPPLPYSNSSVNNAIFCPFQDLYPGSGGTITYSVEGAAPCRKFIISWENMPMFSCTSLLATQQIVLHEGSYRIDMNVINKPICSGWLNGVGYMGIQNSTATTAFTPPAYNGGTWSISNESWSFIPVGNLNLSTNSTSITQGIYWVDSFSNNIIGFGDTLHYWPTSDTTIYVFFGDTTLLNDSCFLGGIDTCINVCGKGFCCSASNPYIRLHSIKPSASFSFTMVSTCLGADVQFFNTSQNSSSYYWDFGDGTSDTTQNPQHTYLGIGPYNVTLIATGFGCSDSMSAIIAPIITPVQAAFTLSTDSTCASTPITSNNTSLGSNLSYTWYMGDSSVYTSLDITHTYLTDGVYTVLLIILDTLTGCTDSTTQMIYVDDNTQAKFAASPLNLCSGQYVYISDTLNQNTVNYFYDMGNGDTIFNTRNPSEKYLAAGDYTINLHSTYPVCSAQIQSQTIHVDDYPVVDLGSPEEICTGRSTITITDNNNSGAVYLWSTGETNNSILVSTPGTYQVTVTYGECDTKASKIITPDLDCIFIPTAFSPNGDGLNDYFKPIWYDINDIGLFQMMIYNRYGQQLYNTSDKTGKGWNGAYKAQVCEMGTYMYYITIVGSDGTSKAFKGDVTLVK